MHKTRKSAFRQRFPIVQEEDFWYTCSQIDKDSSEHSMKRTLITLALTLMTALSIKAAVKLPAFFSDGMVLQQQTVVNIWGKARPDTKVTIKDGWNKKATTVISDSEGAWSAVLHTPEAGGPYILTISDGEKLTLQNILIGEVWLCSGQSNMEMPMKGFDGQPVENAEMDAVHGKNPNIHFFTVPRASQLQPTTEVKGQWSEATTASIMKFSATGYYFGRLINEILNVPVGLILTAYSGSSCEAWMTADWLKAFPEIPIPATQAEITSKNKSATLLYNGMLHPLIGYTMRGVIWYQGESNVRLAHIYRDQFTAMIKGWRGLWKQGDFPFYFCQIAPYDYTIGGKNHCNSAYLREAQLQVAQTVPNTGMACLMDVGLPGGYHPKEKRQAGERLALLALDKTYGIEGIHSEAPVFRSMTVRHDTVMMQFTDNYPLTFNYQGSTAFRIAGPDSVFHQAKAWSRKGKIYAISPEVQHPVAIRYAFDNTTPGELFGYGLPVSSFRSDDWPDPKNLENTPLYISY